MEFRQIEKHFLLNRVPVLHGVMPSKRDFYTLSLKTLLYPGSIHNQKEFMTYF